MKKALLVTTVSGFVPQFEMGNVKILQDMGYEVHYAANFHTPSYGNDNKRLDHTGIIQHQVDFVRSPYKVKENWKAYKQLKRVMHEGKYDLVHCHTPMGGVLARLAAHRTFTSPVIYTAHGFHFYQGAPKKNWLLYYPMEKFLSRYTFQQICINKEDYKIAKTKFQAAYVNYIPGVGIDLNKIDSVNINIQDKKKVLGLPENKKILLSVGELIKRKNHETVIKALALLNDSSIVYVICGKGELEGYLKNLCKELKVDEQVYFLGYREDILEIYRIADAFVFPSWQEGLPFALLEAMASGLPVICSDIRGNRDLVKDQEFVIKTNKPEEYCLAIRNIFGRDLKYSGVKEKNWLIAREFGKEKVEKIMRKIYERAIKA